MRILLLTNEYPPNVYGGAGVHVTHLCRELVQLDDWEHQLQVMSFGNALVQDIVVPTVTRIPGPGSPLDRLNYAKLLDALYRNLMMTGTTPPADLIHCHTWYTYLAGLLLKPIMQAALVITLHSLEPHRPWKKKQLAEAYRATCWLEKTALLQADRIIAVSAAMKQDIINLYGIDSERIEMICNGIDTRRFQPIIRPEIPASYGIDVSKPFVLFVGRVTHQKGILHLVNALPHLEKGVQAVLCAGAPDTPEIGREMEQRVAAARQSTANPIIWIHEMVPVDDLAALYSHAEVFICPSIYEPFGIINLEAMACGTPVVAAAVGGIPEVVTPGETGLLVPFARVSAQDPEPLDPQQYALDLAAAINSLLQAPEQRKAMGLNARRRAVEKFGWDRIAAETRQCYEAAYRDRQE